MDISSVTTLVSTVGFPIAMCFLIMYYTYKKDESHREETKEFTEALNTNTLVLQKLCDKLGIGED